MNRIIGSEKGYMDLLRTLKELDEEDFPLILERKEPEDITLPEIKEFIDMFKSDSGYDITFHLSTCDDCGKLHLTMVIDQREEYQYGKLHVVQ